MNIKKIILAALLAFVIIGIIFYFKPTQKLNPDTNIDKILVNKHERELHLISNDSVVKTYSISLGKVPIGDKHFEGDNKTPEGIFTINDKNQYSCCHKNLGISYPNQEDIEAAKAAGKSAGGEIKIHGLLNGYGFIGRFHLFFDWTGGCIAVTDKEMDELYEIVEIGTPIEIKP